MKRYVLNAEFLRWESSDKSESKKEVMTYVVELETDEEAQTRLDSLIIERMSSKTGWTYVLVNSSFAEFNESMDITSPTYRTGEAILIDPAITRDGVENDQLSLYIPDERDSPEPEIPAGVEETEHLPIDKPEITNTADPEISPNDINGDSI